MRVKLIRKYNYYHKNTEQKPVHVQVYINRTDRTYVDTGVRIAERFWDAKNLCVSARHPVAAQLNTMIEAVERRLLDSANDLIEKNEAFTAEDVKQHSDCSRNQKPTFYQFALKQLEVDSVTCKKSTIGQQRTAIERFEKFRPGIRFNEIDYKLIHEYHAWLIASGIDQHSSSAKHKPIRKYINRAINYKLMQPPSPYAVFRIPTDRKRSVFVTFDELKLLISTDIKNNSLARVRDLFLFAVFTGLSYADLKALTRQHLVSMNGLTWIKKRREKLADSEPETYIPVLGIAVEIMNRLFDVNDKMQVPSNQKFNAMLKIVGKACGISTVLTVHVARHTTATLGIASGMGIDSVKRVMGHASLRTTEIYSHTFNTFVAESFMKLQQKLIN